MMDEHVGEFARDRLSALLARPDGWGSPEAVELQVLLLVEVALVARGELRERVDGTHERYVRFLARAIGQPNSLPLFARLGLTDRASMPFVDLLRAFVHSEGIDLPARA
jgi:hypothetical protein